MYSTFILGKLRRRRIPIPTSPISCVLYLAIFVMFAVIGAIGGESYPPRISTNEGTHV